MKSEKEKVSPISFSAQAHARAKALADEIGWSGKQFVERCFDEIEKLADTPPDERVVPEVVLHIDLARRQATEPVRFPVKPAPSSTPKGETAKAMNKAKNKVENQKPEGQP